ncbi:hypothetical protein GCM10022217_30970 [Chryseobacterium ginsenosidimutans]|uniref:hypothetical protein n=1 Tax=Chryseobacterium ginsenosidimutans TaxID=687846 RepID=UPI0031E0FD46
MKKIILLAAFSVAGLVSANNSIFKKEEPKSKEKTQVKESSSKENEKENKNETDDENSRRTCTLWYTVEAPCGAVYYLCGNNYWDYHDLHQAMDEINEIKCN